METKTLQRLRGALYGNDAAALTAVVDAGLDDCLQLAGDALLVALVDATDGSAELAARCTEALHSRGRDGDDELADELDAARGVGTTDPLPELAVDLEELGDLLDVRPESGGGRIDLTTGEVWPEFTFDEAWTGEEADLEDEDRWLYFRPVGFRAAYEDVGDFTASRPNRALVTRLDIALNRRGAFRRFKGVLLDWPDDREDWFRFSNDRARGRARAWLAEAGYRPTVRRSSPASA